MARTLWRARARRNRAKLIEVVALCVEARNRGGSTFRSAPLTAIAICVPVRDEEALLPDLLAACARLDRAGLALSLCLFLDGCGDGSAAIARAAAARHPFPLLIGESERRAPPSAGRARRAAMEIGLGALGDRPGGLLLCTDADSAPAPDWAQAARRALAHADVAAGRLVPVGATGDLLQARLERYYDRLHARRRAVDPVPWDAGDGSHHGGGANMAVRAEVYRALGGFPDRPSGEDALFLDEAARAGWRVRHDPHMLVRTSARREGRAPGGLAAALRGHDAGELPRVAHPADADWQYRMHALARATFALAGEAAARGALGRALGLGADHVLGVARDCPNAEAFATRIVPAAPGGPRLVPLAEAEDALAAIERADVERAA